MGVAQHVLERCIVSLSNGDTLVHCDTDMSTVFSVQHSLQVKRNSARRVHHAVILCRVSLLGGTLDAETLVLAKKKSLAFDSGRLSIASGHQFLGSGAGLTACMEYASSPCPSQTLVIGPWEQE